MAWTIELDDHAKKDLARLDKSVAKRIMTFLHARVALLDTPRQIGEALKGERFGDYWKYRVGDYRIVADIQDQLVRILVVNIGHRSDIYRG